MKGIYKGFKCSISQFFAVKEPELEIGGPTEVKHVAHIGWDCPSSGNAPSWMNEIQTGPDFAETSIGGTGSAPSPWSSNEYGEPKQQPEPESKTSKDISPSELPPIKKKPRKKKCKQSSSPRSSSASTVPSRGAHKSKGKLVERNEEAKDDDNEVAQKHNFEKGNIIRIQENSS